MVRDSRWPFLLLVLFRGAQLLFGIITLGCAAFVVSTYGSSSSPWWASIGVFIGLVQFLYCAVTFGLYFANMLLPLAVVIVDAFLLIFNLTSLAGTGASGFVGSSCNFYGGYYSSYLYYTYSSYSYTSTACSVSKGAFTGELLSMLLFIATLAYSAIVLHRTRDDVLGRNHAEGVGPAIDDGEVPMGAVVEEPKPENQQYYPPQQQQQQQQYYPQPGTEYPPQAGSPPPQQIDAPATSPPPQMYAPATSPPEGYVNPPPAPPGQYVPPPTQ